MLEISIADLLPETAMSTGRLGLVRPIYRMTLVRISSQPDPHLGTLYPLYLYPLYPYPLYP